MTDQKPNCSTCEWWQFHRMNECDILGYLSNDTQELIKKIGCLSHPGAKKWMIRDVIAELEQSLKENEEYGVDDYSTYNDGLKKAISLMEGRNERSKVG